MDVSEENMSPKEMLEKIAELDHSQSQLKGLNAEMRHWLDVADDDMVTLRSENAALKKQVTAQVKLSSVASDDETEPCRSPCLDELDETRCTEEKTHKLEEESNVLKEKNKTLTAELKSLQQEKEQNQINLSNLRAALQTLQFDVEEAQLGLQRRDEVIDQKNLKLQYLEDNVEEYSNTIKELRLTNQELKMQLEDILDNTFLAALNKSTGQSEGSIVRPRSFADELKLLASSPEVERRNTDFTDMTQEKTEESHPPPADLQTKRCAETVEASVCVRLFKLCIFILAVLVLVSCAASLPIDLLWNSGHLILQPYCNVQYRGLPPI